MRIVILDGEGLNPGDLDWSPISSLGETEIYPKTPEEKIEERSVQADILVTNKTPLTGDTIGRLKKLRMIATLSTGYNVVDVQAAAERGIPVANVPAYCTRAVAQMAFALLFELTNRVSLHARAVREGEWCASPNFCFWKAPLVELQDKTMGIIGFGNIGQAIAQAAQAFGMRVMVCGRRTLELPQGYCQSDFETLLKESDVLSLNVPLTPQTQHLINRDALKKMKPSAYLINTSRGTIVEEEALAEALNSGRLAGAGLDVLSEEPPKPDNPLLTAKNCVITPHIAWAARESRVRLMETVAENIRAYLAGRPQNIVNRPQNL